MEREADGTEDGAPKVQANLAHYLYRDQIRHLQSRMLWPAAFDVIGTDGAATASDAYGSELTANMNHHFRDLATSSGEEKEEGDEVEEGEEGEEEPEVDAMGNTIVRERAGEREDGR